MRINFSLQSILFSVVCWGLMKTPLLSSAGFVSLRRVSRGLLGGIQ